MERTEDNTSSSSSESESESESYSEPEPEPEPEPTPPIKTKKQRSQKQIEAFERCRTIRAGKAEERKKDRLAKQYEAYTANKKKSKPMVQKTKNPLQKK